MGAQEPFASLSQNRETGLRGLVRRMVRRAYSPEYTPPSFTQWFTTTNDQVEAISESDLSGAVAKTDPDLLLVVPTIIQRCDASEHAAQLQDLLHQAAASEGHVAIVWGLQGAEPAPLRQRIKEVTRQVKVPRGVTLICVMMSKGRKADTLNASFRVFAQSTYRAAGWIDDDVLLSEDCIPRLYARMVERQFHGAVGPEKIAVKGDNTASRLLHRVKNITTPATNYPHGCCIIVERAIVQDGIPHRYTSDDGFVCFEVMERNLDNVPDSLEVFSGPWCKYVVGAPKGTNRARIKRLLIDHWVFMCDYPVPVAQYYWANMLFAGFWPAGRMDLSNGIRFAAAKWALKLLYFGFICSVGVELFLRGVFNRPLGRVSWGGTKGKAYSPEAISAQKQQT
ncbi:hypothetical protein [Shimia ponticola]|uniref:hypothetical protein n=1 Tax=Shimia ponticola TaxID=2582893 RepID=UPI0011BF0EDF|nr:hypothetical protein [Shimia ponticola]